MLDPNSQCGFVLGRLEVEVEKVGAASSQKAQLCTEVLRKPS